MTRSVETTSSSASELSLPGPKERRRLREAADLTHEQVAAAVGVTVTTIRSWEAGRTSPRGRKREAYAAFLAALAAPPQAPAAPEAEDTLPAAAHDTAADRPPEAAQDADQAEETEGTEEVEEAGAVGEAEAEVPPGSGHPAEPPAGTEAPAGPTPSAPPSATPSAPPSVPAQVPAKVPARTAAEAFDALYAHAAPTLARQTYLLTGRRTLALEAVERAFIRAWDQWPEVATDPDPVGWVRAAAYEYALSPWHRFRSAHRPPDKSPAEPADRILLDALLALPPVHRRTVLLYDGLGLDLPDTAAETEASTPTTGHRLLHAHADLADRIPELADVPPEKQSALLHNLFTALRPAVALDPRPAAAVRGGGERRVRRWTRATVGLTAVIAVATAYTVTTAPTRYVPPMAPGQSVSGVPPLSGPQQLTEESRQLHDKLRADPDAGPARIAPKGE